MSSGYYNEKDFCELIKYVYSQKMHKGKVKNMFRETSKLVLYRNLEKDSILFRMADICEQFVTQNYVKESLITEIYVEINKLLDVATQYGFDENLWHNYLAYLLATNENPFSITCEKVGATDGTVNQFAKGDFRIFKALFDYDFSKMEKELGINCFSVILELFTLILAQYVFFI